MVGEVLSGKRNEARQSGPRSFLPSAYDRAADAADTAGDVLARVDLDSCRSGEGTLLRHTDKLGSWWGRRYDAGVPPASAFAVASCEPPFEAHTVPALVLSLLAQPTRSVRRVSGFVQVSLSETELVGFYQISSF